jgi:hypothetical protein
VSQNSVERFLGRLLTDDMFRSNIKKAFLKLCRENDFNLTKEEAKILLEMDFEQFIPLSEHISREIKRSCPPMEDFATLNNQEKISKKKRTKTKVLSRYSLSEKSQ